jgi:hypothetical protein
VASCEENAVLGRENLIARGCTCIVVLHDSDGDDETKLRVELHRQIELLGVRYTVILIPVEELEAWLLADPDAIKTVFNMRTTPRIPKHTENIRNPKEYLGRIVGKHSKAHYINTVHNRKIAAVQRMGTLAVCPSFSRYPKFLQLVRNLP